MDIDKLMLRNVYSIGISDASSSSFVLRMKNKAGISGDFLKKLGLVDTTTGTPLVNDATITIADALADGATNIHLIDEGEFTLPLG